MIAIVEYGVGNLFSLLSSLNALGLEAEITAAGGCAAAFGCDVTDRAAVEELADRVVEVFGRCDFLINGAGGNNAKATPGLPAFDPRELDPESPESRAGLFRVDMDAFESVLRTNTMGTVYPTLAFSRHMARQGGGSIVNFASMNTYCPLTKNFAYAMAKAAVENLTKSFAAYFAPGGIRINAVAPGFVVNERSKLILGTPETGLTPRGQAVIDHTPTRKFGQPDDMCGCVRFLLDQRMASFVTGVTVPVDGGFLTLSGV